MIKYNLSKDEQGIIVMKKQHVAEPQKQVSK